MLGSSRNIWTLCSTILITVSAVVSSLILMVMNIFTSFPIFFLKKDLQSNHMWQPGNLLHLLQELVISSKLPVRLYLLSGELPQLKEELLNLS